MLTKDDLSQIRGIVQEEAFPLRKDIKELRGDVKVLKKDVTKIRKDINTIVNFFDRDYLDLRQRVENIEQHLGITLPL